MAFDFGRTKDDDIKYQYNNPQDSTTRAISQRVVRGFGDRSGEGQSGNEKLEEGV